MSRRHAAVKRQILPDAKYLDILVAKFINCLMKKGKKSVSEKILYGAIERLEKNAKLVGIEAFKRAVFHTKPTVEVRSKRIGGATYQVPVEVKDARAQALAIKWLINAARKRSEKTMEERLGAELNDAFNNRGNAIKKREETHKMAEANKAFAHYKA